MLSLHKKIKNNNKKSTGGFTLVEVIIVMVVAAILLGVGGLSLANYVHSQKFRRQNEYAQSLFIAAQTSLTHMKAIGELASFADDVRGSAASQELNSANSFMGVTLPAYTDEDDGRIWSIMKSADDDSEDNPVNRLLSDYIFDRGVLSAAIAVELDPSEGIVTAVLYSDASQTFSYSSGAGTPIADREKSVRSDNMVGFWYADSLSDVAPGVPDKPSIKDLALVNDETLHLDWRISNVALSNYFTYEIRVFDASSSSDTPVMTITAPGSQLAAGAEGADTSLSVDIGGKTSKIPFFVRFNDDKQSDSYGMISLIFDAVDMADIDSEGTLKDGGLNLSFARFGIDTEDIYVRMQASAEGYKSSTWKESGPENAYFDARSDADGFDAQYIIVNMRHLSNVRVSEARGGKAYSYLQTADVIWSG
ncbi:MAG: type II secretion system protein, partial [Eubacteriales bacterium]